MWMRCFEMLVFASRVPTYGFWLEKGYFGWQATSRFVTLVCFDNTCRCYRLVPDVTSLLSRPLLCTAQRPSAAAVSQRRKCGSERERVQKHDHVSSSLQPSEGTFRCKSQSQNGFDLLEETTVKMSYMYDNFTEKI